MAGSRNLHRIDLYCPQYKTHATILIDENHGSGGPYLVAHYEKGGLKGQMQFAAAIPAHWGDNDLAELIFLPAEKRENPNWPTWEVPAASMDPPRSQFLEGSKGGVKVAKGPSTWRCPLLAESGHAICTAECLLSGVKRTLTLVPVRRRSGMGFNRRKMEDQRRQAAEKETATRRATDGQVPEDAGAPDRRWK